MHIIYSQLKNILIFKFYNYCWGYDNGNGCGDGIGYFSDNGDGFSLGENYAGSKYGCGCGCGGGNGYNSNSSYVYIDNTLIFEEK